MSGSGRKRVSKWDSKEDTHHNHSGINTKSASYYCDEEPEPVRFNVESNSSRRSAAAADDQNPGDGRIRRRVGQNNDNSYYSEQDETRQQIFHRSGSRSYSRSRSRSRSPVYRARRDAGSYDRHKTRTRDSPTPRRGGDQSSDYGWEDKLRKPREMKYHGDEFREQAMMKGARSSDYDGTDFPEDGYRREHLHDGVSDPRLRRHRSELTGEKETQRRDGDGDGEGDFRRSSNIPCKFFASGFCRNGNYCRFSHHGAEGKQPQQDSKFYRQDNNNHSGRKWNDVERLDNGKSGGIEVSRVSKGISESKGNSSSWIDDMKMSPDWNYGAPNLKNPMKEEPSVIITVQSSQSHDQRSSGMFPYGDKPMVEKSVAVSHQNYSNPVNMAPVQTFNQNTQNVLPYQSSLTAGGSQQVLPAPAADFSVGSNLSNPDNGTVYHHSMVEKAVPAQNTVTREQIDQLSNISASIAQILANGQPIPQLSQVLQLPLHSESSMADQPNHGTTALHAQSNSVSNNSNPLWGLGISTSAEGVPMVNNVDGIETLEINPKASEENGDKKTDEEGKKTGEDTKDAENAVDEDEDDDDDDDGSDEENKKGKDPKGIRAFKFALVEIVKELLKPAGKEGKMKKDGYKNIVKKVVEKVTGTMQNGNVPQTQDKIDHYQIISLLQNQSLPSSFRHMSTKSRRINLKWTLMFSEYGFIYCHHH